MDEATLERHLHLTMTLIGGFMGLAGENRGHVGKHGADGVIYTGGGDKEHQKRDQRQVAAAHECHPREDGGGDAQL